MPRTLVTLLVLLALPSAAQAATATTADGNLRYQASPGEINNVVFARVSGDTFRVTDTGATITAGTGCGQDSPNVVTCTTAPGKPIIANLADQNDRASSHTSRAVQFYGEDGNDRLGGASGRDLLDGGPGDDNITGGSGRDRLRGGPGDDQLFGNSGNDNLHGGDGNDLLVGGSGNDYEAGDNGDDTLREDTAPNGSDSLNGNAGNDTVDYSLRPTRVNVSLDDAGNDGDVYANERDNVHSTIDRVLGSAGSDMLVGRDGPSDTLIGGAGDDVLIPLRGADHVDGGAGIDQIYLRDLSADDAVCGDGVDSVAADQLDSVAPDCEKVRYMAAMSVSLAARAAYPTIMLRITCPLSAFKYCQGRAIVRSLGRIVVTRGGRRPLTLAVRRFNVPVGSSRVIGLRIRSGARPYLSPRGLVVRASLSAYDGAGPARRDATRFRVLPR